MSSANNQVREVVINSDGGSRGNPGPAGIGFAIWDKAVAPQDNKLDVEHAIAYGGAYIGTATNNVAEYKALIWALQNAQALHVEHVIVRADSELLVKQINGLYKVKNADLKLLYSQVKQLLDAFQTSSVEHVYRDNNKSPDALVNQALDEMNQEGVGSFLVLPDHEPEQGSLFSEKNAGIEDSQSRSRSPGFLRAPNDTKFLVQVGGSCKPWPKHGATWDVEIVVSGNALRADATLVDQDYLIDILTSTLKPLEHAAYFEGPPFDTLVFSEELMAREIYINLFSQLGSAITLHRVTVFGDSGGSVSLERTM